MVEEPKGFPSSGSAILRSLDEIDGSAFVYRPIPYRDGCAYTSFKVGLFDSSHFGNRQP